MSTGAWDMLRQGFHSAGFFVTDYIGGASDRIAIGYRSGAIQLGYYQNAMFIYENLCALLVLSAHNVAVATLVTAQNSIDELRRLWRTALSMLAFFAMPAFGILAVTGQDLIVVMFGAKWSQAGVLISIIALRGIPHSVERTMGWLHVTAGRTDRWMRWGFVALCAQLTALFCGLPYGPTGVAVAFVVCTFIMFIPAVAYSGRPFGINATDVIKVVWRPLTGALSAAAVGFALRFTILAEWSAILRIVALAAVYLATYVIVVVVCFRERMPIQVVFAVFGDVLPARLARSMRSGAPPNV
jgi:PST family polysaccharide transporter